VTGVVARADQSDPSKDYLFFELMEDQMLGRADLVAGVLADIAQRVAIERIVDPDSVPSELFGGLLAASPPRTSAANRRARQERHRSASRTHLIHTRRSRSFRGSRWNTAPMRYWRVPSSARRGGG